MKRKISKKDYKFFALVGAVTLGAGFILLSEVFKSVEKLGVHIEKEITTNSNYVRFGEIFSEFKGETESYSLDNLNAIKEADGSADVVRVVDEYTYVLNIDGKEQTVRLAGIAAPSNNNEINNGESILDIINDKIKAGDMLFYEFDESDIDENDIVPAYLYFLNGTMVQHWLL